MRALRGDLFLAFDPRGESPVNTIRFKNTSKDTVNLASVGLGKIPPGQEVDVPLHLAAPARLDNGSRGRSAIEKCAPQMEPVDPVIRDAWKQVPDPLPPRSLVVTTQRRPAEEPAGVKALRAAQEAAEAAQKAPNAPGKPKGGA